MSGLDGLGWPNPEDEPKPETMNDTPTPETDAAYKNHPWDMHDHIPLEFARRLERERDEARRLCRWAFPRLRTMCHDFDATGTGWCCAEEMGSHPEIFSENA
jgi:hypothetical protein